MTHTDKSSGYNIWQAQFGRLVKLKRFSIFGVLGKLTVHVHKSRTAACQHNIASITHHQLESNHQQIEKKNGIKLE